MTAVLSLSEGVATIELRRPARHNAVDVATIDALDRAVTELERLGPELRGVVLAGAGASFCSGADLGVLRGLEAREARQFMLDATSTFRRIERLPAPVIAAAKGYCLGGGLELLLHCDLILAREDAVFGFPEAAMGFVTTAGSVARLCAALGTMPAKDMLLTGRRVTAAEAHRLGLVAEVVAGEDVEGRARARAGELARLSGRGLAAMKALIAESTRARFSAAWIDETEAFEALLRAGTGKGGTSDGGSG